jgi:hypothetical protein
LYPNPVDQILNVDLSGFDPGRVVEIRIIDVLGRTASVHRLSSENTTIDVGELLNGSYILTAAQGPILQKKKFFKH